MQQQRQQSFCEHTNTPTQRTKRQRLLAPRLFASLVVLTSALGVSQTAGASELLGTWILDPEKSEAVAPKNVEQKNFFKDNNISTSVSVGGMGLPRLRRKVPPVSSHAENDPGVLRCKTMRIEQAADDLRFTYVDIGTEVRKKGHYRGVDTKWNKKSLTESYKTTTRKVKQKYQLVNDNELLVTVIINPHKSAKRTYKQVFTRQP